MAIIKLKKRSSIYQTGGPSPGKAKEMLRDGTVHGKKLTPKQKRYFGFIAGGGKPMKQDAGLVTTVPKDFEFLREEGNRKYYKRDRSIELGRAAFKGKTQGGPEYNDFLTKQLQGGVSPQELVTKGYIHPDRVKDYESSYKPQRDVIYTEANPTTGSSTTAKPFEVEAFGGEPIYYNNAMSAMVKYPTRKTGNAATQGGKNTGYEDVEMYFTKNKNTADLDYNRGMYKIPYEEWNKTVGPARTFTPQTMQWVEQFKQQGAQNNMSQMMKQGGGLVDYMKSRNIPTDYSYRTKLAKAIGISGYAGTAAQNSQIMNYLQGRKATASASVSAPKTSTSKYKKAPIQNYSTMIPGVDYSKQTIKVKPKAGKETVTSKAPAVPIKIADDFNKLKPSGKRYVIDSLNKQYGESSAGFANALRTVAPVPKNVSQLAANLVGDARMNNASLSDEELFTVYKVIQNAQKRTGKGAGGTEYEDYGDLGYGTSKQFTDWFNKGTPDISDIALESPGNTGFRIASTIGRGSYYTDPDTGDVYYTDVHDWNAGEKMFSGKNSFYQTVRNALRTKEQKEQAKAAEEGKKPDFTKKRMLFKLDKKAMEEYGKKHAQKQSGGKVKLKPKARYY